VKISVIGVLYGGSDVLHKTLPSWRAASRDGVEFVMVDHSPQRLDADAELDLKSWANYVWNPANPGFAAGVNAGVAMATAPTILLLNPDVFLESSDLERMLQSDLPELGAIGLRTDGVSTWGIEYSWWGFCRDRAMLRRTLVGPSGGAAVIHRRVLDAVGPFPEHLFAWGEDAEWALLAYSLGFRAVTIPMVLEHIGGHSVASLAGQRFKARLLVRNRIATFRRLLDTRLRLLIGLPFAGAIALNAVRKLLQGTGRAYLTGVAEGLRMTVPPTTAPRLSPTDWRVISAEHHHLQVDENS
jgi:GT2 family glycosyltransferase